MERHFRVPKDIKYSLVLRIVPGRYACFFVNCIVFVINLTFTLCYRLQR